MPKSKPSWMKPLPILTIPGSSYRMGAMILAEIGNFSRFDSPDKILAYAGMSPSTYQPGQLDDCYAHTENEVQDICVMRFTMRRNMSAAKSGQRGKHYNVVLSHATKKLLRLIYAIKKSGQPYSKVA